jgi:hypothetical protein
VKNGKIKMIEKTLSKSKNKYMAIRKVNTRRIRYKRSPSRSRGGDSFETGFSSGRSKTRYKVIKPNGRSANIGNHYRIRSRKEESIYKIEISSEVRKLTDSEREQAQNILEGLYGSTTSNLLAVTQ